MNYYKYTEDPAKYYSFRCVVPNTTVTDKPWFPIMNVCPCDPSLSNPSGRGIVPCPYGFQSNIEKVPKNEVLMPLSMVEGSNDKNGYKVLSDELLVNNNGRLLMGSMYQNDQYVPPQMDPRSLWQIGYNWRS